MGELKHQLHSSFAFRRNLGPDGPAFRIGHRDVNHTPHSVKRWHVILSLPPWSGPDIFFKFVDFIGAPKSRDEREPVAGDRGKSKSESSSSPNPPPATPTPRALWGSPPVYPRGSPGGIGNGESGIGANSPQVSSRALEFTHSFRVRKRERLQSPPNCKTRRPTNTPRTTHHAPRTTDHAPRTPHHAPALTPDRRGDTLFRVPAGRGASPASRHIDDNERIATG